MVPLSLLRSKALRLWKRDRDDKDYEVLLEFLKTQHIHKGSDIGDPFAHRAGSIIRNVAHAGHMDQAGIAWILQEDATVNGTAAAEDDSPRVLFAGLGQWKALRNQFYFKVQRQLMWMFRKPGVNNAYQAAWSHVSKKCLNGQRWADIKDDSSRLPMAMLVEGHRYLDSVLQSGRVS